MLEQVLACWNDCCQILRLLVGVQVHKFSGLLSPCLCQGIMHPATLHIVFTWACGCHGVSYFGNCFGNCYVSKK